MPLLRRPVRLLLTEREVRISLSLSAASFCEMTVSQEDSTASRESSPWIIERTRGGSERWPLAAEMSAPQLEHWSGGLDGDEATRS